MKNVVRRFRLYESKLVGTFLGHHKLLITQAPSFEKEMRKMKTIPCSNEVRTIIYRIMCDTSNLAHVVCVVSKFMADLGRVN